MNLYDRVVMTTKKMSQVSSEDDKNIPTYDTEIIRQTDNCPNCHSRARDAEWEKESVPIVTYVREADKGIFTNSININRNSNSKTTPRARVTIGTQPPHGQTAAKQFAQLKKLQTNIKTSTINVQWDQSSQELIDWFIATHRLEKPFYLEPHCYVFGPDKFYASLENDVKAGFLGPRNRYGAVMDDIKKLKKVVMSGNYTSQSIDINYPQA